jgi:RsiW-degrading membrane proteinase PrsW (M82 family)
MNFINNTMPIWLKRSLVIGGLLLILAGLPLMVGYFCITLVMTLSEDRDALQVGLVSFIPMIAIIGGGGVVSWHSWRSLQRKISKPIALLPLWMFLIIFGLGIAIGLFITKNKLAAGLLFPPVLFIATFLPPLGAVSWFVNRQVGELTWRRGLVALAGGATVSIVLAAILEILFPTIILALVFNLGDTALNSSIDRLVKALNGREAFSILASRGFIYFFVQSTLIVPLVEELVKPLATLPLIGRLSRRGAFLVGAMAGVGFAAIENAIYAGFGFVFWVEILVMWALGGAIQPLGSGLVSLGWHGVLRHEANGWRKWLTYFGLAVGLHACWNSGSLLVVTLVGAQFFGKLSSEIDQPTMLATGATLALLLGLGWATLWSGRSISEGLESSSLNQNTVKSKFVLSNRAAAIWALACLVAIVPAGIAGFQILTR